MKKHLWGGLFALALGGLSLGLTPATADTVSGAESSVQQTESNQEVAQAQQSLDNSGEDLLQKVGIGVATAGAGAWLTVAGKRRFRENCDF